MSEWPQYLVYHVLLVYMSWQTHLNNDLSSLAVKIKDTEKDKSS